MKCSKGRRITEVRSSCQLYFRCIYTTTNNIEDIIVLKSVLHPQNQDYVYYILKIKITYAEQVLIPVMCMSEMK
jgi:hypothetical protein